jgi:chromosome segregation ATPase
MSMSRLAEYSSQLLIGAAAAVVAAVLAVALYVQSDRAGDLQAGLDQLKKDYTELNAARGRLAAEKEAVERDRNGLRERAEKTERERNEVGARVAETARLLQAEQQALGQARNDLTARGREVAVVQVKITEVEKDRDGLRERAEKAERESGKIQAQQADMARLLQAEQQALEKTRGELAARGRDLAAGLTKIAEVERERDGLRGRTEKAERESGEAQSRQVDTARQLQAEQQALNRTRGELASALAESKDRSEEIRRLEAKLAEAAAHATAPAHSLGTTPEK